ncbi:hypothetical protein Ancab_026959 [Ancistrocladus abbreviatus]
MEYSTAVEVCGLLLFWVLLSAEGDPLLKDKPACHFPAVYNFGESNSDTGGIPAAFWPSIPPLGETFFRKPAGRSCNGRLLIDFLVVSPCGNSILPRPGDFSKALYTFDIGQNDLGFVLGKRATIPDLIAQFSVAIEECNWNLLFCLAEPLWPRGKVILGIHNTGPLGCLPAAVMKVKDPPPGIFDPYGCIKSLNNLAMEFNKQLKDAVVNLRKMFLSGVCSRVLQLVVLKCLVLHVSTWNHILAGMAHTILMLQIIGWWITSWMVHSQIHLFQSHMPVTGVEAW